MKIGNWIVLLWLSSLGTATAQSMLIVSVDGLSPDYVLSADKMGLAIPNLRRYVDEGSYARGVIGVLPTVTYPSHTTMVTGVHPAAHGIINNTTFDPMMVNRDGWYWYAEDIRVPTLWQVAHAAGLSTAAVNWPVTVGDTAIDYLLPEFWRTSTADDLKLLRAMSRPEGLQASIEAKVGPFVDGYVDTLPTDLIRTAHTRAIIEQYRPGVTAVHLIALDGEEHRQGPFVAPVLETLEGIDAMIGELEDAALAADPEAVLVVVSDHGFIATHTAVNLRKAFVDSGLIDLEMPVNGGAIVTDWRAQMWPAGASAAVVLKDLTDSTTAAQVLKLLQHLQSDPANGIARIVAAADLESAGGFSGAVYGIDFMPGFYLGGALTGSLTEPATSKGTHGYWPDRTEMNAAFFIRGSGIAAGRDLGIVDMRALAPTMALALGLSFTSGDLPAMDVFAD